MATFTLDATAKTVTAQLNDQEFSTVSMALQQSDGADKLQQIIAYYLQQQYQVLMEANREKVKGFVTVANDAQIAAMLTIVNQTP